MGSEADGISRSRPLLTNTPFVECTQSHLHHYLQLLSSFLSILATSPTADRSLSMCTAEQYADDASFILEDAVAAIYSTSDGQNRLRWRVRWLVLGCRRRC